MTKYCIIDADRHVMEPAWIWREYLSSQFKGSSLESTEVSAQDSPDGDDGLPLLTVDGLPLFRHWTGAVVREAARQSSSHRPGLVAATDPSGQLGSMDQASIRHAYLFPTFGTYLVNHEGVSSELSAAYASAYNRWLRDYCSAGPDRLHGVGLVSRHEPSRMLEQLAEVVRCGWTCVALRPEIIRGRTLGHPDYDPFWSACAQQGIAVALHGGTHLQAPTVGHDRFTTRFALHACAHPLEAQMAFLSLLEAGVLERYPTLRVAFLEAGASWLPHWLWRLDEVCYRSMPNEVSEHITMLPSEYFKRQCWIGIELDEPGLQQTVEAVGADRLLFGSDFPHPDHACLAGFDDPTAHAERALPFLGRSGLQALFEDNPRAFFGLPTDAASDGVDGVDGPT